MLVTYSMRTFSDFHYVSDLNSVLEKQENKNNIYLIIAYKSKYHNVYW